MIKIDIFSGFLGAGKTTLIKKLIKEAYAGEKVVLIENEFGEIGIDGGFLKDAGVEITEMNSGCICCSLVGDFSTALKKVAKDYSPDRIIIEPSGVGKLSDVILAVEKAEIEGSVLNGFTTIVDANKCKMYAKNFGEFFINQVEHAATVVLSHTANMSEEKIENAVELIRTYNGEAVIVTTDWGILSGEQILSAIERKNSLEEALHHLHHEHEHHHHHHEEGEECHCHEHHHDHDADCHCHDHKHHNHHHEDGEECHCHDHEHHHADEVFTSFGRETTKKFTKEQIERALTELSNSEKYGMVLRAKGIVECACGKWLHFDYVPNEPDVRVGSADIIGRICVIGAELNESAVAELFGL